VRGQTMNEEKVEKKDGRKKEKKIPQTHAFQRAGKA
jgi:hypothetical protein